MKKSIKLTWFEVFVLLVVVGVVMTLATRSFNANSQSTATPPPTNQVGGPYTPRTYGGQDLLSTEWAIRWQGDELKIPSQPGLKHGITYSIEVPAGTYDVTTKCTWFPDFGKNGKGDLNSPLEFPTPAPASSTLVPETAQLTFSSDGWALVYVPPGVTDCTIKKAQ